MHGSKTIIIAEMGAKHSRLSEEDFLFLEEETGMSKATLEVSMDIRFSLWYDEESDHSNKAVRKTPEIESGHKVSEEVK